MNTVFPFENVSLNPLLPQKFVIIEKERQEVLEIKEKIELKRDFCTIEEYIFLYKEYEKQNKQLKLYLKDIRSIRTYNRKP